VANSFHRVLSGDAILLASEPIVVLNGPTRSARFPTTTVLEGVSLVAHFGNLSGSFVTVGSGRRKSDEEDENNQYRSLHPERE
jgi:hypothetical protein